MEYGEIDKSKMTVTMSMLEYEFYRDAVIGRFQNRQAKKAKVMFRNGYSKNSPYFIAECSLSIGTGKEEWGSRAWQKILCFAYTQDN